MTESFSTGDEIFLKNVTSLSKDDGELFPPSDSTVNACATGISAKIKQLLGPQPHMGKHKDKGNEPAYIIEYKIDANDAVQDVIWEHNIGTSEECKKRMAERRALSEALVPGTIVRVINGILKGSIGRVSTAQKEDIATVGVVFASRHLMFIPGATSMRKDSDGGVLLRTDEVSIVEQKK